MTFLEWILVAIVCGAIEIFTAGFWFLWLAIAGVVVALLVQFGLLPSLELQLLIFALITLLLIIFTRPLVMKFVKSNDAVSNVKALIGQHGITISRIVPMQFGQVKVNGEIWTAISEEELEENTRIEVIGIDGVKLLVKKAST
ncbi:MAG TPA: NfeD family protein [Syntrophomonadaceae bacterium]|nr:NfeD family protein [Syntrophomonadaceae bacterium]HOQ09198.1 NfeD family protein [Syntrophomonadaceae bacterium]HPU48555.1 NfeD family protein [Syntrophomonadaceae bacterium]